MDSNIFALPTVHMNIQWDLEGRKWSPSTGVDSGTFTCIEGSAPRCTELCLGDGRVDRWLPSEMLLDKCTQYDTCTSISHSGPYLPPPPPTPSPERFLWLKLELNYFNIFVYKMQAIKSKCKIRGKLGHAVHIYVCRLAETWILISLIWWRPHAQLNCNSQL